MACNRHDLETQKEIMKEELKKYQDLIINWAEERNITGKECIPMQKLKLIEEVGEIANAIVKNKKEEQADGIGDCFVVLTILAEQNKEQFLLDTDNLGFYKESILADLLSSIIYFEYNVSIEVLLELCNKLELDIIDCVSSAWNEIKDRRGKTENGVFLKN